MPGLLLCIKGIKCVKGGGPFRFFATIHLLYVLAYRTYYMINAFAGTIVISEKKYCNSAHYLVTMDITVKKRCENGGKGNTIVPGGKL